ncbi:unnamed protein product [Lactuca saligna]|uniref:Uncharacterized protein n=1 Tax=Lactuca saligna TaxID=75948 RepID=A0AA36EKS9_LACSI|nr:unnamed protein product [Lactuca saligna]
MCFNCRGVDYFSRDCKSKKVDTDEDYEVNYKKLLGSLKRETIDVKVLVVEVENYVPEEESSDKDKGKDKCLMAHIEDPVVDKERGSRSFKDDLAKVAKDSKHLVWDSSSSYQVNKFITYTDSEKSMMFNYLCHHLSKVNKEKHMLRVELDTLMNNLSSIKKTLAFTNSKVTNLTLSQH